jgi:Protein of unknown function (DUF3489)
MPTYTIDESLNITAHESASHLPENARRFASEDELANLTTGWALSALADTWNSFAGVTPFDDLKAVKKFTDRSSGVTRIWKAVQRLSPQPAPQTARVAPKRAKAKQAPEVKEEPPTTRDGSKKAAVLELLRRPDGATLEEIMTATSWQAHTVRGFISGTLGKKLGLAVESVRGEDKVRTYSIAS